MSNHAFENNNTQSFYAMAWIAFVISFIGMAIGVAYLEADLSTKGFIAISYLFSVTSCFTVAKVVRDKHETQKIISKIEMAKTEKLLSEHSREY
jgi:hypothetical protein